MSNVSPLASSLVSEEEEEATDVFQFLLAAPAPPARPDLGVGRILEVVQVVGDAVTAVAHIRAGQPVVVGDAPGQLSGVSAHRFPWSKSAQAAFCVPAECVPEARFRLLEPDGDTWSCRFLDAWAGFLLRGSRRLSLGEIRGNGMAVLDPRGGWVVALRPDDALVLHLGAVSFVVKQGHRSLPAPPPAFADLDAPVVGIVAFIVIAGLLIGGALAIVPPPPAVATLDLDHRVFEADLFRVVPPPPAPAATKEPAAGSRAKDPEGGSPKAGPPRKGPRSDGIVAALDGQLDEILGDGNLPQAVLDGVGAMIGSRGTQAGPGLGYRGPGFGAGGRAAVGQGPTFGDHRGTAFTDGIGDIGGKREAKLRVEGETILGPLDRSLIDAEIKRHLAAIRYCYQRELPKSPDLSGRVSIRFVIAGTGEVSSAAVKSSTLANPAAEACISGRFLRMRFPAPLGGGIVIVTYPFVFSTT